MDVLETIFGYKDSGYLIRVDNRGMFQAVGSSHCKSGFFMSPFQCSVEDAHAYAHRAIDLRR